MNHRELDLVENDVLSLARAMPADKYDFVPSEGAFAGVRTFAEQAKHLATMVYMTAAIGVEKRSPYGPGPNDNGPEDIRSKEQIIEYLQGAFAYAREAVSSLTIENQQDLVETYFGPMPRSAIFAGIAYHSYSHYGQMVVYARLNGIAPPHSVPPLPPR